MPQVQHVFCKVVIDCVTPLYIKIFSYGLIFNNLKIIILAVTLTVLTFLLNEFLGVDESQILFRQSYEA